jgi:mRNA interferase HigB
MRILTKKRIDEFIKKHPDAGKSLLFWFETISRLEFLSPKAVIFVFNTADYVGNGRMVFNIAHNKYRLVAKFEFSQKIQLVFVRFIGTHQEYDAIDDIQNI